MAESSDAGEVQNIFFDNHIALWFKGELVFAWLDRWMQVKFGGSLFAFQVKSYLHG